MPLGCWHEASFCVSCSFVEEELKFFRHWRGDSEVVLKFALHDL